MATTESYSYPTEVEGFQFTEKSIRHAFIRKVYSILMLQLLITGGFITLFVFNEPTRNFTYNNPWLMWVALVTMFTALIALGCCGNVRRKAPLNFIFLILFTVAESFCLGTISAAYETNVVLIAVGITVVVCFSLTVFAFQTKWDFTAMGGILFAGVMIALSFGILCIFWPNDVMILIYSSLGVFIFSIYIIYDTQLMLGGKHKYAISPEEYIFAALNLYLDIVNMFLYILTIVGIGKN